MQDNRAEPPGLYAATGARKYLNEAERRRVLEALHFLKPDQALFVMTLAWTGARVTEVLTLTPAAFQIDAGKVALRTLKWRRPHVRELPLPPWLMAKLDERFALAAAQRDAHAVRRRLWPWHRTTAWRLVKRVMLRADVDGCRASPRGLRHGFGVGALQAGAPITLVQRWLGHARLSTTAIYADVSGAEEIAFASRYWHHSAIDD